MLEVNQTDWVSDSGVTRRRRRSVATFSVWLFAGTTVNEAAASLRGLKRRKFGFREKKNGSVFSPQAGKHAEEGRCGCSPAYFSPSPLLSSSEQWEKSRQKWTGVISTHAEAKFTVTTFSNRMSLKEFISLPEKLQMKQQEGVCVTWPSPLKTRPGRACVCICIYW